MDVHFSKGKVSLVVAPIDMRYGFFRLAQIAHNQLLIDVSKGKDWVVYISKSRNLAKVIGCDEKGSIMITKYLNEGKYQRLMMKSTGKACKEISVTELEQYLNGDNLEVKRDNLLKN